MFESELETYPLTAIKVVFQGSETLLQFSKAVLRVDASDIYFSWFVDITDIAEVELLERLANALDIQIMMYARTTTGLEIAGEGYLHPNLSFHCAAIKGEGELIGYEQIKQAASL
ncbi:MAG: hypothetical protein WD424_11180 [Paenibacillaceae bacterium]